MKKALIPVNTWWLQLRHAEFSYLIHNNQWRWQHLGDRWLWWKCRPLQCIRNTVEIQLSKLNREEMWEKSLLFSPHCFQYFHLVSRPNSNLSIQLFTQLYYCGELSSCWISYRKTKLQKTRKGNLPAKI